MGHFEKVCKAKPKSEKEKSEKKRPKINKVKEEDSDNSEYSYSTSKESSSTDESDSTSAEETDSDDSNEVARVAEVRKVRIPLKRNKRGDVIGKIKEKKARDKKRIHLKLKVNVTEITAMLDTGSPISLMPQAISKRVKPEKIHEPPMDRKFVDLNGNEVIINRTFIVPTQLNNASCEIKWWEVNAKTTPILGMDSFKKLKLKLVQHVDQEECQIKRVKESEQPEMLNDQNNEKTKEFSKQLYSKYQDMFTRVGEIRNFEYNVEFVPNFWPFQQKRRKSPIHLQDREAVRSWREYMCQPGSDGKEIRHIDQNRARC